MTAYEFTGGFMKHEPYDDLQAISSPWRSFALHGDDRFYTSGAYHTIHQQDLSFQFQGKYHSFDPIREHRHAGYYPMKSSAGIESIPPEVKIAYPRHVFQGPAHHYGKYHPESDLNHYFISTSM